MIQETFRPVEVAPVNAMTDVEFDAFCNELAVLAQEAAALGLPDTAAQTVEGVRKSALAQHFRIVLVSPFQGGKSTIFNTVCGGRELSPTGFGLKTSAAIAEARYLEDAGAEEYAEVEWRSDEELIAGMEDLVFPQLARSEGWLARSHGRDLGSLLLDDQDDRRLLMKGVRDALRNPEIQERIENFDVLKVAWLTLEHYEGGARLRQETQVPPPRAHSWLSFPAGWSTRSLDSFQVDELAFLFLKRIVFYLREPALRRLRASVIDAPGLQASRWDTAVTTDCIRQAHAVIFLLGTQGKGIAQDELRESERFHRFDLTENVFYGYNARNRSRHLVREHLLPNDLALLKSVGFEVPEERVSIFNALLAYRSRQYELLSEGRLSPESIRALSDRAIDTYTRAPLPAGGESLLENARYLITKEIKAAFSEFTGRELEGLSVEVAREAARESNWEDLIARASRFVISRKGPAILLDRGSRQIEHALDRLDGDLQDREKAAERDASTMQKEKEQAEAALKAFEKEVEKLQAQVEQDLGSQGRRELLSELRGRLDKTGPLETSLKKVTDETESPRYLPTRLASEATDFVEKAVSGWQSSLTGGTSRALGRISADIVKPAEARLQELARLAQSKAPGLLPSGATLPIGETVQVAYGDIREIVYALYPKSSWTRGVDWTEEALDSLGFGEVVSWLRGFVNREILDSHVEWRKRIPTTVRAVKNAAGELAAEVVETQIASIQETVKTEIDRVVLEVREAYKARLRQRESDLARSSEEQKRISTEAAERRRIVARFRERVDHFSERVSRRLGIIE